MCWHWRVTTACSHNLLMFSPALSFPKTLPDTLRFPLLALRCKSDPHYQSRLCSPSHPDCINGANGAQVAAQCQHRGCRSEETCECSDCIKHRCCTAYTQIGVSKQRSSSASPSRKHDRGHTSYLSVSEVKYWGWYHCLNFVFCCCGRGEERTPHVFNSSWGQRLTCDWLQI